jgi:DNA uptake protein ComE-like DNA-binding protein
MQGSAGRSHSKQLNLNSASAEELERVSQIDGERARYLIEARDRIGGFRSWEDVKREAPSFEAGMVDRLKQADFRI